MKKLLTPFGREFKEVSNNINTPNRLDITILGKHLIERKNCQN